MCVQVYMHTTCVQYLKKPEEGTRYRGIGVTDGWEQHT